MYLASGVSSPKGIGRKDWTELKIIIREPSQPIILKNFVVYRNPLFFVSRGLNYSANKLRIYISDMLGKAFQ